MPHPSSVRSRCRVRSRCGARPGRRSLMAGVVAAVLAVVLASAGWLFIAPEVEARPQDRHGPYGAVVEASDGVAELGQFQLGDTTVWCIDLNSYGPQKASGWVRTRTDRIRKQTSFGDRAGHADVAGDLITREEMAELAWVLEWAEHHVDDDATAIAVDHFIRLRSIGDQAQRTRMDNRLEAAAKEYPDVPDHLARLEELVDAEAGPFRMELKLDVASGSGTAQVVGRAGKPIPGRAMTVTVGEQRVDVTSDSTGVATFDLPKPDSGEVNVSAEAVMPGSIPVLHTPRHYDDDTHGDHRIQRMLSAGEPAVVRARDSYRVGGSTPSVVTVASAPQARVGAELHDVVRVTGAAGYRGRATAQLWGPFPDQPGERQCRDEQMKAGEVEFDIDGDGSYTTPNITVEKPGHYTWTVHLPRAPGFEGVDTPCGIEAETTEVLAAPVVETDIDAEPVASPTQTPSPTASPPEPTSAESTFPSPDAPAASDPARSGSPVPEVPMPDSSTTTPPSADSRGPSPRPSGHRASPTPRSSSPGSSSPKPSTSPNPDAPSPEAPAPESTGTPSPRNTDAPEHPSLEPEPSPSQGTTPPITSPTPLPRSEAPIRIRSGA